MVLGDEHRESAVISRTEKIRGRALRTDDATRSGSVGKLSQMQISEKYVFRPRS